MIYIFPIFLFGCAVTGVVFLGIIQAADQVKEANAAKKRGDSRPVNFAPSHPQPADSDTQAHE